MKAYADVVFVKFTMRRDKRINISNPKSELCLELWSANGQAEVHRIQESKEKPTQSYICAKNDQAETMNGYGKTNASRQSSLRYRIEMQKLGFRKSRRGCCTEESKSSKVAAINRSEGACHITALGFALFPSAASAPGVAAGNTAVLP
jgi:hypothetical protein